MSTAGKIIDLERIKVDLSQMVIGLREEGWDWLADDMEIVIDDLNAIIATMRQYEGGPNE
jgi:hypothetical protein